MLLARSAVRVYRLVPIAQHVSQLLRWATVGANRPNPMQSGPQLGHVDDPVAVRVLAMGGTVIFMPSSPVCIVWVITNVNVAAHSYTSCVSGVSRWRTVTRAAPGGARAGRAWWLGG